MYGYLQAMLTMMKGIPLAYDKDMQEDKFLSYETIDLWQNTMKVMAPMVRKMKINTRRTYQAASNGFSTATDMADYLVRKGLPFREAHRVVGQTVRYCVENDKTFDDLTLEEFKVQSSLFEEDILMTFLLSIQLKRENLMEAPPLRPSKFKCNMLRDF